MSGAQGAVYGSALRQPYQPITFNEIPTPWLVPGTYAEIRPNYEQQGLQAFPSRALIIAPMLTTGGTAAPYTVYPITRSDQPRALFGAGSIAANMANAFLAANPTQPLFVMPVPDPVGGASQTWTYTVGGTATANGTQPLYVAGVAVPTSILQGDAAAVAAAKIAYSIDSNANLPVGASVVGPVMTITAKNAGVQGANIDVRSLYQPSDALVPGLTVAIASGSAGAGLPATQLATAIADIASQWFTDIIIPWSDAASISTLATELASRYKALGKLDAHGYFGMTATYAAALTAGLTLNSQFMSVIPMQNAPSPPWIVAAATGAVAMFNLTNDPARQLSGKALPGVVAPAAPDVFTLVEREQLLSEGLSTYGVLQDGTVVVERLITTYQQTPLGVPDQSWLDIMTPKTLTRIRYDWRHYVDTVWAGVKLAPDGSIAAQYDPTIATPRRMQNSWAARSLLYEQQGWITNSAQTAAQSVFEIDSSDGNRLDSQLNLTIIGNLIVQAAAIQFTA